MRHFRTPLPMPPLSFSMLASALAGPLIATAGPSQASSTGYLTALLATKLIAAITTSADHTALAAESASELSSVFF